VREAIPISARPPVVSFETKVEEIERSGHCLQRGKVGGRRRRLGHIAEGTSRRKLEPALVMGFRLKKQPSFLE
jgi:hypothetical protein